MFIRNRKAIKEQDKIIVEKPKMDAEFKEMIEIFSDSLPANLKKEDRIEVIAQISRAYRLYGNVVRQAMQNVEPNIGAEKLIKQFVKNDKALQNHGMQTNQPPSVYAKAWSQFQFGLTLSGAFGLLTAFTGFLPVAAAELIINKGQPSGGLNLCSGIILDCIQGYLTNGTAPWTSSDIQFSRTVDDLKLKSCLDTQAIGNTIISSIEATQGTSTSAVATATSTSLLNNAALAGKGECFAQSAVWRTKDSVTQATSRVANLPVDTCQVYQNNFASRAQAAHDAWFSCGDVASAAAPKYGSVKPILLGVAVVALCLYAKDYFVEKNKEECTNTKGLKCN